MKTKKLHHNGCQHSNIDGSDWRWWSCCWSLRRIPTRRKMKGTDQRRSLRKLSGCLTRTRMVVELHHVMINLGEKLTDEEVDEMIREAEVDGHWKINYKEFVKVMMAK
ncbi:hypothetical protein COLO4_29321 [Corchorus olitorius]|uniref:EF-hand domain-containing protein n=1 Tax=Corchorus olitorius TaxID=93759 RepID=A0A1R3HF31_9ROSI|nr:hypothetical protein COLO4_29321 [Corchorus olitorius]